MIGRVTAEHGILGGEVVEAGGVAHDARVVGSQIVSDGGVIIGTVDNGFVGIESGGVASGLIVSANISVEVASGGLVVGAQLIRGGMQVSGGSVSNVRVSSGAGLEIGPGSVAKGVKVESGGGLDFFTAVVAAETISTGILTTTTKLSGVTLSAGAFLGGLGGVVGSGGTIVVGSGGIAAADIGSAGKVIVSSGGAFENGLLGSDSVVGQGGVLRIASGGEAAGALVSFGGTETVLAGGVASGTRLVGGVEFDYGHAVATLLSSGREVVQGHGTTTGALLFATGSQVILAGGVASSTIMFGGALTVSSGGAASTLHVDANASATVLSGGLVSGVGVEGGYLNVASGAVISGRLGINNSVAVIAGTLETSQPVVLGGVCTLELDNLAGFHAKISGFNSPLKKIELGGFAHTKNQTFSWTQSGISGTLTVEDGGKVAKLTLIGLYTSGQFRLTGDGHGGTIITDPVARATTRIAQVAAGLVGGRSYAGVSPTHVDETAPTSALVTAAPVSGR